jgi:hypothetical protein
MTMTDPKPLPPFTLPAPEPPKIRLWARDVDSNFADQRLATVDDLRAVLLAMRVDDIPEGWSVMLSRPEAAHDESCMSWKDRALAAEARARAADRFAASAQAQSFARSCVGDQGDAAAANYDDYCEWRRRALAAEARAEKAEAAERFMRQAPGYAVRDEPKLLAEILDWAFSKCDSDEPEETAMAQVQLLWQEMVDECETQAAEIDGLKLLLRKAQDGAGARR